MRFSRWLWFEGAYLAAALMMSEKPATAAQSQNWAWFVNLKHTFCADLAIRGCTAVVQSKRQNRKNPAAAFNNRGLAYFEKGDDDRAIVDYNEAIRLDPKYAAAFNVRGFAYGAKGDYDRAIVDYGEVIRIDPKGAAAF